jgi:hypothetical protein
MKINGVTGFTSGHDGALACKHRDISVCPVCFADCPDLIDVYGEVYRIPADDPTRAELTGPDCKPGGPTEENMATAEALRATYAGMAWA